WDVAGHCTRQQQDEEESSECEEESHIERDGQRPTLTSSHPKTLSNGFCQPDRPANRAAAHSHQCQQTRQQRGDRVNMLLPDSKVEQGKRHSIADHMTRRGLCSEQARPDGLFPRSCFISFLLAAYRL